MTEQIPLDEAAERAVLGCVLIVPAVLDRLVIDEGLRAEHFYRPRHTAIFEAMVSVSDSGHQPDSVTVADRLGQAGKLGGNGHASPEYLAACTAEVPGVSNAPAYAQTVIEMARLRRIKQASYTILAGVDDRDDALIEQGERLLLDRAEVDKRTSSPDELAERAFTVLEGEPVETMPWPFERLNKLTNGGMRRGQLTLIAGWSSHGKSVLIDQSLEIAVECGLKAHLYINEMTRTERTERTLARLARVDFNHLATGELDQNERTRIVQALPKIPFGITDIAGWSAADVARDVRRRGYDLVGVDIVNRFPGSNDREQLEEISRVLNELTKESQANCHLLLGAHLNRNRATGQLVLPPPSQADLRGSAMLYNDADNCLFVHREQDEDTGDPLASGVVRFAKARNGKPGGLEVAFIGKHMRFEEARRLGVAGKDRAAA